MRNIIDRDTAQIEITNTCMNACSNCTRFCGLFKKPYFMSFKQFKEAVDSFEGFPKMVGIMGGEPLLHPEFKKFCKYALSKKPKEQLLLESFFSFIPPSIKKPNRKLARQKKKEVPHKKKIHFKNLLKSLTIFTGTPFCLN